MYLSRFSNSRISLFHNSYKIPDQNIAAHFKMVPESHNRLESLPNEILYTVLSAAPDILTLFNLTAAYPSLKPLYVTHYEDILVHVLQNSAFPQISKLASFVLLERYSTRSDDGIDAPKGICLNLATLKWERDRRIDEYISDETQICSIDKLWDPLRALEDIATLYHDTDALTEAFFHSCCRRPGTSSVQYHEATILSPAVEMSASPSEIYRIHRAMWRFWATCQAGYRTRSFGEPQRDGVSRDFQPFIETLTSWEFEELMCIYHFLQQWYFDNRKLSSQTGARLRSMVCDQTPIVQRLLLMKGYDLHSPCPATFDEPMIQGCTLEATLCISLFEITSGFYDFPQDPRTIWSDAPTGVNLPNEGWLCFCRNKNELLNDHNETWAWDEDRVQPKCPPQYSFYKWGYCIWDYERLRDWAVLDEPMEVQCWAALDEPLKNGWGFNAERWHDDPEQYEEDT